MPFRQSWPVMCITRNSNNVHHSGCRPTRVAQPNAFRFFLPVLDMYYHILSCRAMQVLTMALSGLQIEEMATQMLKVSPILSFFSALVIPCIFSVIGYLG
ncbi:hypothetical protein C5167_007238 [Papaver somniferum]|nr:hypothetical protein C5167_007238 [Papaver somniferum]